MTKEYLDQQTDVLALGEELRSHLQYLLEKDLEDQVQEILNAFSEAGKLVTCKPKGEIAPPAWANAASIRILALMELPTLSKLRLYLAHFIQEEVDRRVKIITSFPTSTET